MTPMALPDAVYWRLKALRFRTTVQSRPSGVECAHLLRLADDFDWIAFNIEAERKAASNDDGPRPAPHPARRSA